MNRRELTSIIACLGGTSYWYLKISYLTYMYYYMLILYFLDSVVYCLVKRCLIPLIITSMILCLRKFHPRGEESSVMNYFIAFCANRKWSNLFDITHCDNCERIYLFATQCPAVITHCWFSIVPPHDRLFRFTPTWASTRNTSRNWIQSPRV